LEFIEIVRNLVSGEISSQQAIERLIPLIPPFETRVIVIGVILGILLIFNGLVLLIRTRKKKFKGINFLKSRFSKVFGKFNFLKRLGKSSGKNSKKSKKTKKAKSEDPSQPKVLSKTKHTSKEKSAQKKEKRGIFKKLGLRRKFNFLKSLKKRGVLILNIILAACILAIIAVTVFVRPTLINTSPAQGSKISGGNKSIILEFDLPVDKNSIEFNVSPEVEGEWEFEQIVSWLPYSRKVIFHPKQSFYPENEVIIYVVGLRSSFFSGKKHELAAEFKSPSIPKIESVFPEDKQENVAVDTNLEILFDNPTGKFVDLQYEIDPPVEFETYSRCKPEPICQTIDFKQNLNQDAEYKVKIFRTPRSYDIETGEDIERGDTEKIKEFSFSTVTTPLIASREPKGGSVHADKDIRIVFDQAMDRQSVEENFSIKPKTEGEFEWEDDKTLLFKPKKDLKKETEYEVLIKKGVLSSVSGKTEEDIAFKFTTIGRVQINSVSPINGSTGLNPAGTNVVIEFNQEVDHASAESKFSIYPAVRAGFGWEGNKLVFYSGGKLSYSTTYTITVKAGVKTVHGLDSNQDFSYKFTTKPQIVALNVPWYKQQENFTCNLAAARMTLAYRGVYVSENQIRSSIGTSGDPNVGWVSGYGVHWGPVAKYISRYRSVSVKTGWNTAALAREVEKGNPVIVWWYNRYSQPPGAITLDSGATGYNGMHSEVVRGFIGNSTNPTSLMTNDPWRGRLTYSRGGFDSNWAYMGYIAVVVY
jgi:uncharacterized protein YvpB